MPAPARVEESIRDTLPAINIREEAVVVVAVAVVLLREVDIIDQEEDVVDGRRGYVRYCENGLKRKEGGGEGSLIPP